MVVLDETRALFVQPHLDDVAFACGGSVARAAGEGAQPVIIGVFCAAPAPGPLSENLVTMHTRWGLGDDAWLARRHEDERGCAILGARPIWLTYRDAPYRGYSTFASLFAELAANDPLIQTIADDLRAHWQQTPNAQIYMPLGIGNHIDHQLCHAAGAVLERAGLPVLYYEDFPYAALPGLVQARLAKLDAFQPELVDVAAFLDHRVRAAAAYVSQATALFTSTSLIGGSADQVMRRHAGALAGSLPGYIERGPRYAECFYRRVARGG